jgi:hypothetical protein
MWRYLIGGAAIVALGGAGISLLRVHASPPPILPRPRPAPVASVDPLERDDAAKVPEALPATREQKRFDRYDKDRDGKVSREEYLAARRKAFAKLDANGDGRLSFDEWAVKAESKFAAADRDRSGAMDRAEFATTAVKRTSRPRAKCPPSEPAPAAEDS